MREILAVTGLPRCGTSLMMRIISKAGVDLYHDPEKDISCETHLMHGLPHDSEWLEDCVGKCVKLLTPHVFTPPRNRRYRFVFMERNHKQQAKSQILKLREQKHMKVRQHMWPKYAKRFKEDNLASWHAIRLYGMPVIRVPFETLLADPINTIDAIMSLLNISSDPVALSAMVAKRTPKASPKMLDTAFFERVG